MTPQKIQDQKNLEKTNEIMNLLKGLTLNDFKEIIRLLNKQASESFKIS